jgi:hypothetical protein
MAALGGVRELLFSGKRRNLLALEARYSLRGKAIGGVCEFAMATLSNARRANRFGTS